MPYSLRSLAALLAMLLTAPAPRAAESVDLNGFLAGVESRCRGSAAFEEFLMLLGERHVTSFRAPRPYGKEKLPDGVREAIGKEIASDQGSYVLISAPVLGRAWGLSVRGLELAVGKGNGAFAFAIVFASNSANVRAAFGKAMEDADATLRAELKSPESVLSIVDFGAPKLVCNLVRAS